MRQPKDYAPIKDEGLDIIFGQHVAHTICDRPSLVNLPIQCSLYEKTAHWAADEWNRPQPIGAGGEDYDLALEAARDYFGGISIEVVLFSPSKHEVAVNRATRADDRETGADSERRDTGEWLHAVERDRWVSVRRSVIRCILALADAPLEVVIVRPPA